MKTRSLALAGAPVLASSAPLRKTNRLTGRAAILLTITALCSPLASRVWADSVTDWNKIMQDTVAAGNANAQARSGAIVQLSVFEAVNAVIGDYEPYLGTIAAPADASPDAAAVTAAYRTLVTLYSSSATTLNPARGVAGGDP